MDVRPLGEKLEGARTTVLVNAGGVEVIRLVMAEGKVLAEHRAPGAITVHCLEGRIEFTALGQTRELSAGQMLYLPAGEPHAVKCVEGASVLLTVVGRG